MTRLTFGIYRKGVRDPSFTFNPTIAPPTFPTPMPTAFAAVARYHREGENAARRELRRAFASSSYWGPSGTRQAQGWAAVIMTCFERYIHLDQADGRDAFAVSLNRDVDLGMHVVAVHIDAVLYDDDGYVGRMALWDVPPITSDLAVHYAVPVFLALEEELGNGRVAGVQVWHLRTGQSYFATRAACLSDLARVTRIVDRMAS